MTFSCSIRLCSVLCALSLLLAGCGDNEQPTMPTPPAQEGNQYDIIFVSSDFGQPSRLYRMSETGDSLREIPFPIFMVSAPLSNHDLTLVQYSQ